MPIEIKITANDEQELNSLLDVLESSRIGKLKSDKITDVDARVEAVAQAVIDPHSARKAQDDLNKVMEEFEKPVVEDDSKPTTKAKPGDWTPNQGLDETAPAQHKPTDAEIKRLMASKLNKDGGRAAIKALFADQGVERFGDLTDDGKVSFYEALKEV